MSQYVKVLCDDGIFYGPIRTRLKLHELLKILDMPASPRARLSSLSKPGTVVSDDGSVVPSGIYRFVKNGDDDDDGEIGGGGRRRGRDEDRTRKDIEREVESFRRKFGSATASPGISRGRSGDRDANIDGGVVLADDLRRHRPTTPSTAARISSPHIAALNKSIDVDLKDALDTAYAHHHHNHQHQGADTDEGLTHTLREVEYCYEALADLLQEAGSIAGPGDRPNFDIIAGNSMNRTLEVMCAKLSEIQEAINVGDLQIDPKRKDEEVVDEEDEEKDEEEEDGPREVSDTPSLPSSPVSQRVSNGKRSRSSSPATTRLTGGRTSASVISGKGKAVESKNVAAVIDRIRSPASHISSASSARLVPGHAHTHVSSGLLNHPCHDHKTGLNFPNFLNLLNGWRDTYIPNKNIPATSYFHRTDFVDPQSQQRGMRCADTFHMRRRLADIRTKTSQMKKSPIYSYKTDPVYFFRRRRPESPSFFAPAPNPSLGKYTLDAGKSLASARVRLLESLIRTGSHHDDEVSALINIVIDVEAAGKRRSCHRDVVYPKEYVREKLLEEFQVGIGIED